MIGRIVLVFVVAIVLSSSVSVPSADGADPEWPCWRGPGRDGWVEGFEPPARWPGELEQVWQVEVGTGYASPLVSGGRIYQQARQGDEEVVWCLDVETGEVEWRRSYPTPFTMGGGGERHGKGPKSSPALADGRLFTLSITGLLSAWDLKSGESLWSADLSSRFEKTQPNWGVSTSPLVDGNRVVVHFGGDDRGALVALDTAAGKELWSHGEDGTSYASPILMEIDGVRQIVEWNHRALVGVESESGRFLWEYSFPHVGTDQNMPTPAFHEGRVLLGGENRGIRSIAPGLSDGVWTAQELWQQDEVALDMSSAVVNDGLLYGFSHYDSGRLFCLDPESGDVLWRGPARTGQNVAFLSIPGYVVALINDGELRIVRASGDRYEQVASYRVAESPTWAPPALLESSVLVKDQTTLTRWSFE